MGRYVLRRLAESAVTFVLVTIVVFLGVRALPGDPARALAGEESDPATLAADPALVRPGPAGPGAVRAGTSATRSPATSAAPSRTGLPVAEIDRARPAGDPAAVHVRHPRSPRSSASAPGVVAAVRRRTAGGVGGQRRRAARAVGAELLARADGRAGLRHRVPDPAGVRVRVRVRRPGGEPPAPADAGARARLRAGRGHHAADPLGDARRAGHGLRAHRPGQGPRRDARWWSGTRCATASSW